MRYCRIFSQESRKKYSREKIEQTNMPKYKKVLLQRKNIKIYFDYYDLS